MKRLRFPKTAMPSEAGFYLSLATKAATLCTWEHTYTVHECGLHWIILSQSSYFNRNPRRGKTRRLATTKCYLCSWGDCFRPYVLSSQWLTLTQSRGLQPLLAQGPHFYWYKDSRVTCMFYEVKSVIYCWTYPLIFPYTNMHRIVLFTYG
jgi:hypothetical protein